MLSRKDGHRAAFVYLCGLSISGGQGSDGFLSTESLPFTHGRKADAALLVEFGFWVPQPGGWVINGWDEFQQNRGDAAAPQARPGPRRDAVGRPRGDEPGREGAAVPREEEGGS